MVPPKAEDDCCGEKNKKKTKAHNQTAFNDVADGQTDRLCLVHCTVYERGASAPAERLLAPKDTFIQCMCVIIPFLLQSIG